jgi:aromatic-L-amino-acid/L-tryptophan decarboxylase
MINLEEFRKYAHQLADWIADYYQNIESYPVKSNVKPGEIFNSLPDMPPAYGESMDKILMDFQYAIFPGITHWQHPNFYAYFPANTSYPSILAEMLVTAMASQCMIWETSPAAAELEEKVMNWLKSMIGLPANFEGVIQDTASTATLVSILTAREKFTDYLINDQGFTGNEKLRLYCSTETHSSIEKGAKIAGLGRKNIVRIEVDDTLAMRSDKLREAIENDLKQGLKPFCVVATLGTTGTLAIDPLHSIAHICEEFKLWLHVDAAFAGTALVLPENRWMTIGIEKADTFVFNPHKWMFTNFDCSAYFVKDRESLLKTFEILPEYLKTKTRGTVNDYRDWGIQMGRRFRALKLWFVIRNFGVEGIKDLVREHIKIAKQLAEKIKTSDNFVVIEPQHLNVVCFRYHPGKIQVDEDLNKLNMQLMYKLNESGEIYITHTKVKGLVTLRMVVAQANVQEKHVIKAWELVKSTALTLGGL